MFVFILLYIKAHTGDFIIIVVETFGLQIIYYILYNTDTHICKYPFLLFFFNVCFRHCTDLKMLMHEQITKDWNQNNYVLSVYRMI